MRLEKNKVWSKHQKKIVFQERRVNYSLENSNPLLKEEEAHNIQD